MYSSEKPGYEPNIIYSNGLRITTAPLIGYRHKPITLAGNIYRSAADYAIEKEWIKCWESRLGITRDIHGRVVVYWKERFPLFDEYDYELDERHYRLMLLCSSIDEAEEKISLIRSGRLHLNFFRLWERITAGQYRAIMPLAYYEDNGFLTTVEEVANDISQEE